METHASIVSKLIEEYKNRKNKNVAQNVTQEMTDFPVRKTWSSTGILLPPVGHGFAM